MDRNEQRIKLEEDRKVLEQRVSDFKRSFGSPLKNSVYDYLSEFCFGNQSTFDKSSQIICNFNEGSRFVILEIDKWCKDETVEIMLSEQKEILKRRNYE